MSWSLFVMDFGWQAISLLRSFSQQNYTLLSSLHTDRCISTLPYQYFQPIQYLHLSFKSGVPQTSGLLLSEQIFKFIEQGNKNGASVIICSKGVDPDCCCIAIIYLMRRFRWPFRKAFDLCHSKVKVQLPSPMVDWLVALESELAIAGLGAMSLNWKELSNEEDKDELVLTNSLLNVVIGPCPRRQMKGKGMVVWADEMGKQLSNYFRESKRKSIRPHSRRGKR